MLGSLLDLLLDKDGRVQQVHVPELEAEQLAGAEPGGRAEQPEALVPGGYLPRPYAARLNNPKRPIVTSGQVLFSSAVVRRHLPGGD